MSDVTIPDDIKQAALALWIRALDDGTPDAAIMIAEALMGERERCAKMVEDKALAAAFSMNTVDRGLKSAVFYNDAKAIAAAIRRGTP